MGERESCNGCYYRRPIAGASACCYCVMTDRLRESPPNCCTKKLVVSDEERARLDREYKLRVLEEMKETNDFFSRFH